MKFLIVLVACGAMVAGQTPSQKLEKTINDLKDQMPCGFPGSDIPPLAPYKGDFFNLYHKLWILKINGGMADFTVDGLNNFNILNVNLNVLTLRLALDLNFNEIKAKGNYNIESFIVRFLKVRGHGTFDISLKNIRVSINLRIGMVDGVLRIMEMVPTLAIDSMKSKITGLLIGPLGRLVLGSIVDRVVVSYVRNNAEDLSNNISEILVPQINEKMKDLTIKEILDMLQNPPKTSDVCIPPGA